jgi:hypothetical protein
VFLESASSEESCLYADHIDEDCSFEEIYHSDDDSKNDLSSSLSFVSSDSEVECNIDLERPALCVQLAQWAVRNNITDCALGGLLSILKPHHPNLPVDPRTLKKTPQTYVIKEISGSDGRVGQYHYFGIGCCLLDLLQQHQQFDGTSLVLQFNFDGLPLFKSSNMELWPILCLARPVSCKPFVVGLYCGAKKPASLSDYLQELLC